MKKREGISLIVLVITIIVMIILAGAIILTLNNSGIITKASEAVEITDEATVKELAQLVWAEAYADGVRTVEGDKGFRIRVEETLKENGVDTTKYLLNVTTSGVNVKLLKNAWIQEGLKVIKGDVVLEIGDSIFYDETKDGTLSVPTNVEWQVLGADADGNLLILSSDWITSIEFGDVTAIEGSQKDWISVVKQLDSRCLVYGKGNGAIGARSVTIEDVNKVVGYNPTNYNKGHIDEYGSEVTYFWEGTENIKYISSNGINGSTKYLEDVFRWYDEKTGDFIVASKGDTMVMLPTIKNNFCSYTTSDISINKEDNAKAYTMIYGSNSFYYWLASPSIRVRGISINYCIQRVIYGEVNAWEIVNSASIGKGTCNGGLVRAVVVLSSDIQLTGSSETGWSY